MAVMPPFVLALAIGACALYGLRQDLVTGIARDEIYRFNREESPLGYNAVLIGKLLVLGFWAAEVLHAVNLCSDPVDWLRPLFG